MENTDSKPSVTPVPPLLVVDVGNSRIKFGLCLDWANVIPGKLPDLTAVIAVSAASTSYPWDQLRFACGGTAPASLVASVNPPALGALLKNWPRASWPEPRLLRDNSELPIENATEHPAGVGTDRLLKAVAGNVLRLPGQPMILVDCGTATTVDWITASGAFAGGAILPGLRLSSQALHDHTAQLPLIAPEDFQTDRPAPVGTETIAALRSGIYWGQVGAVRELIQRMSADQPGGKPQVLITGGAGQIVARELDLIENYHQHLTLQGLIVARRSAS